MLVQRFMDMGTTKLVHTHRPPPTHRQTHACTRTNKYPLSSHTPAHARIHVPCGYRTVLSNQQSPSLIPPTVPRRSTPQLPPLSKGRRRRTFGALMNNSDQSVNTVPGRRSCERRAQTRPGVCSNGSSHGSNHSRHTAQSQHTLPCRTFPALRGGRGRGGGMDEWGVIGCGVMDQAV